MIYPASQTLRRPTYSFSPDNANSHADKFRGLLRYKPFRKPTITEPRCLFIFDAADRDDANRLYSALRSGIGSFPGMRQFIGVTVGRETLTSLRLPSDLVQVAGIALYDHITEYLQKTEPKPEFVFIIGEQRWKYQHPSPYSAIKASLIPFGLPSQLVSKDLLNSETQFQYAITNIALATLVKLGGIPWLIQRPDSDPGLVLGIGTTVIPETPSTPRRRFVGFAFCMLSDGLFLDLSLFGSAATYEEFLPNLKLGIRGVLTRLNTEGRKASRLSVHVSHLERRTTVQAINAVLDESRGNSVLPIPFEVLRLTHDSAFAVIDPQHPGYVSAEGTVVHLSPKHALIVTEGRQEQAKWRNRKPVTLEVHREHAYPETMSFEESLNDTFRLCFVNWRAFSTMSVPVSLAYAKMLSERVAEMSLVQPAIVDVLRQQVALTKSLWFL